jgi:hypothetical protein
MTVTLPPYLSFCFIGRHTVFLDTRRDRYFMLPAIEATRFRDMVGVATMAMDDIRHFEHLGLLSQDDIQGPPLRPVAIDVPTESLLDHIDLRAHAVGLALIEVSARLLAVRQALRRGRLDAQLSKLRSLKEAISGCETTSTPEGRRQVGRFLAARRIAPTAPNCLLDSLALSLFLARRTIASTVVIGVKLDPFAAHCWLQDETMILNDTSENASAFTPILVI